MPKWQGKKINASARLKGDFNDHRNFNKQWSLKLNLRKSEHLDGMTEFSITNHRSRNFPYNFVISKNLERMGLIVPKYKTVKVIFERCLKKKKPLTVVRPGNQSRRFTHINDAIKVCFEAWKNNRCLHYSISNKKIYSILEVAKFFKAKIKFLPKRDGERYASALTNLSYNNKVHKRYGKIQLKDYINSFIKRYKK